MAQSRTSAIKTFARFWDTLDLTEFEADLEEVAEPVFAQGTPIRVHLEPTDAESLRQIASAKGISEAELIRDWVRQRLVRQRLDAVLGALDGAPRNALEISPHVYEEPLTASNAAWLLSQTLCYLRHLELRERVARAPDGDAERWVLTSQP